MNKRERARLHRMASRIEQTLETRTFTVRQAITVCEQALRHLRTEICILLGDEKEGAPEGAPSTPD